jgi:hypothetical protein
MEGPTRKSYRITIITICNYDQFQLGNERSKSRAKQRTEQRTEQVLPYLPGLIEETASQPNNQRKHLESSKRSAEEAGRGRSKPHHGAKGRGMVWLDHGTPEWALYAADFKAARGADKLPENRIEGRGNWFRWLGEKKQA